MPARFFPGQKFSRGYGGSGHDKAREKLREARTRFTNGVSPLARGRGKATLQGGKKRRTDMLAW